MSAAIARPQRPDLVYPDRDGQPMSDNTLQFEWIVTFQGGVDALFRNDPDVFVAGDLLWYPVEGQPKIRTAPDVMVAFGRPKGYRGSYQQWKEEGIAPQVAVEITSPGNSFAEIIRKFEFYQRYGVEEYYLYDPDRNRLEGWRREGDRLQDIPDLSGWVSPRLGIRFEPGDDTLRIYTPDGMPFKTYVELAQERDQIAQERDAERERAERLAGRLRELGIDPGDV